MFAQKLRIFSSKIEFGT